MLIRRGTYHRLSTVGQCALMALGIAWALFERAAPVVNVRWRDDLDAGERQRIEQELFLEAGEPAGDSWRYDLAWPAASNIAAIIQHPEVIDTHHLDRARNRLAADVAFGRSHVWWVGPFKGARGRAQFRYLFGAIGALTLMCAWLARRAAE